MTNGRRTWRYRAMPALAAMACAVAAALPTALASAAPGTAASDWATTEQTRVRLVSAVEAVGTRDTLPLGIEFKLAKGWKIYWRSPGDAGFPPRPDFSASRNLADATLRWPAPTRFSVLGLETMGYEDEVVLPLTARLKQPGQPLSLKAKIDYLTCKEICIPYTANVVLDLPAGNAAPSPFAHLIDRFAARVPGDGSTHGLAIEKAGVAIDGNSVRLRVKLAAAPPFVAPDLFVEGPVDLVFAKPQFAYTDGGRGAIATLDVSGTKHFKGTLSETPLTLTLVDGLRSAERKVVPNAGDLSPGPGASASLAVIVGLALLGGLILNLMPCVLPVLSIKLLGVVGHGGGAAREVRFGFLASAAGIVVSFLVLAAALIGVKAAGGVIGWGIQFQQPIFLIAMTLVVTLFAANLWGLFEIRLPVALASAGGGERDRGTIAGHFVSGIFATLLATPCSAPFLGTAVAFALSRGAVEILWVFAAIGVGLALPYLAVAAVPALATRLPRPGRWMIVLRRLLGFALAGTGIWLVSVLVDVIGTWPAVLVGIAMAAIVGLLAAARRITKWRVTSLAGVVLLAVAALAAPLAVGGLSEVSHATSTAGFWKPFDESAIDGLVAQGRTVFVDVTADWCVTCQVNKAIVLDREPARSLLSAPGVVAMMADWTRPDDAIARYLARFGRYGIPFNVVYGPGAPQGIVLPELLSTAAVSDAFKRAGASAAK